MDSTLEMLDGVEEELVARAFLFVDPPSYRDGVEAATRAIRELLTVTARTQPEARTA